MKITKKQLRRIIKEEKAKLLNEYNPDQEAKDSMPDISFGGGASQRERQPGDPKTYSSAASMEAATKQLEDAIMAMLEVLPRMELAEELREYAKDVAMNRKLGS